MLTLFRHLITHSLFYEGDCKLLGISNDDFIFVEELYGDEDWLAQHKISLTDGILESVDELSGDNLDVTPLELPSDIIKPNMRPCCEQLNFSGPRLRGMADAERIDELVLPLTIADKIELVDYMEWGIQPTQLIGIAENAVLSNTLGPDDMTLVCRRVRVAYRFMADDQTNGVPQDYDSLDVYVLHEFDPAQDDLPDLVDCLNDTDGVVLLRPMDCLFYAGRLYVADGGEDEDVSAVHVFEYQEKVRRGMKKLFSLIVMIACFGAVLSIQAQTVVEQICPSRGIQQGTANFEPSGIIVASFDKSSLWVYDIERATRYPLPDTVPCTSNCRLSPDATWLTYYNAADDTISMMRLNGTGRRSLARRAIDVEWWSYDKLLVWTTIKGAYIQVLDDPTIREELEVESVLKVQPAGYWGLRYTQVADVFQYQLVNLQDMSQFVPLSLNRSFNNNASWSPDGRWLAYVGEGPLDASVGVAGGEIFAISPDNLVIEQWSFLSANYGAVRINGHDISGLSWSPDGRKIAFWVMEIFGSNVEGNVGQATIHILDVDTKEIRSYCGYGTEEHTPNPPSLVWSPDSSHLAFAGNIPGDEKGYLLLAMDIETGNMTEFSDGVYPNYGSPNVIAWGRRP